MLRERNRERVCEREGRKRTIIFFSYNLTCKCYFISVRTYKRENVIRTKKF